MCAKKLIFGILLHVAVKNGKYLASIIDDSVIMCNETIEETKTVSKIFNNKKVTYKTKKIIYFTCFFINCYSIIDSC